MAKAKENPAVLGLAILAAAGLGAYLVWQRYKYDLWAVRYRIGW